MLRTGTRRAPVMARDGSFGRLPEPTASLGCRGRREGGSRDMIHDRARGCLHDEGVHSPRESGDRSFGRLNANQLDRDY